MDVHATDASVFPLNLAPKMATRWRRLPPVTRARWTMQMQMCVALLLGTVVMALGGMWLHGANQYPRFLAAATQRRRNGEHVWVHVCKEGEVQHPVSLVRCADAQADAALSVRRVALEETLAAVLHSLEQGLSERLGNVNPVYWVVRRCGVDTMCHYVLWKSVDAVTSSMWITVPALALLGGLIFYCCWRWPVDRVRTWMEVKRVSDAKRDNGTPSHQAMTLERDPSPYLPPLANQLFPPQLRLAKQ